MAGAINATDASKRYAVVTGGNKGIGFEICRQLACEGVTVVLTARNEDKGSEAVEKLRGVGISDNVLFHRLDVTDASTVSSLVHFVNTNFGRLDILVNNAGVIGVVANESALRASVGDLLNLMGAISQNYELAAECIEINYYGSKRMTEAFLPLLQQSKSPRIVNVTSGWSKLENIHNEWAKGVLNNVESPPEKLDEVVNKFLEDYKNGSLKEKGWPSLMSAYVVSKAAMNAYARITAHKYPSLQVNCVNPGYVKTDITYNTGKITAKEGAQSIMRVALQSEDGPSGVFFDCEKIIGF
ncbi:PREDICTED: (+)-neomenthol dehydrogenase-like isoform X2 [Ipomoea nil]|uniref:(+)-neomenthol dehydrogenase-like isoform X2 n=1 Tax=Ipomoea nil TaxID=35883 RepID=UPI000901648B|nr:PREDICTED: (+)-neomenthol dehydrogenase-like isoform X2 [Ipomoea nil]